MITAQEARELLEKEIEKQNGQWLVELESEIKYTIEQDRKSVLMVDYHTLSPKGRIKTLVDLGYKVSEGFIDPHGIYPSQSCDYWLISW